MKALIVLTFALSPGEDDWFGPDKLKHFMVSAFLQTATYSALQHVDLDHAPSLASAAVFTLGVGVGKELHDRNGGGAFSGRDLAWNAVGVGAGSLLVVGTR